jgi:hypothetical protein
MKKCMGLAFVMAVMLTGFGFGDVIYSTTDRIVSDTDGDGLGNNLWTEKNTYIAAGDAAVGNAELRSILEFNLSDNLAVIASATNISFYVEIKETLGTPPDWQFVHLTEGNNGSVVITDFHAAGTVIGSTQPGSSAVAGTWVQFDVTDAVKADALAGNWSAFRLQASAITLNGKADVIRFYEQGYSDGNEPYLMISVPEPSVLGSLFGGGVLLIALLRWRGAGRRA